MKSDNTGLDRFIKTAKPLLEKRFGTGKITDDDLSIIYGMAVSCAFDAKFCIHKSTGACCDGKGSTVHMVRSEGFPADNGWQIMEEHRNLSFEKALQIRDKLNTPFIDGQT